MKIISPKRGVSLSFARPLLPSPEFCPKAVLIIDQIDYVSHTNKHYYSQNCISLLPGLQWCSFSRSVLLSALSSGLKCFHAVLHSMKPVKRQASPSNSLQQAICTITHTHADTHTCSHTAGQSVLSISRELGVVYSPCPEQHSPPPTSPQIQSIAARSFAAELCVGVCKREMCSTPSPRSSPKLIMQMTVTCITFFSFFFYNIKCDSRDDKEKKRTIFWRRRPRPERRMR